MNTKVLSPAFITSLVAIFVAALMIGASSTILTVLGWLVLLAAVGLNVVASMVSIQRAKGGALCPLLFPTALGRPNAHPARVKAARSRNSRNNPNQFLLMNLRKIQKPNLWFLWDQVLQKKKKKRFFAPVHLALVSDRRLV